MQSITRSVRDLDENERRFYEAALGATLQENQQVILQVITVGTSKPTAEAGPAQTNAGPFPDWCNVYGGLSDDEIASIETAILDRDGWNRKSQ